MDAAGRPCVRLAVSTGRFVLARADKQAMQAARLGAALCAVARAAISRRAVGQHLHIRLQWASSGALHHAEPRQVGARRGTCAAAAAIIGVLLARLLVLLLLLLLLLLQSFSAQTWSKRHLWPVTPRQYLNTRRDGGPCNSSRADQPTVRLLEFILA